MLIIKRDGRKEQVKLEKINKRIINLSKDLKNIEAVEVAQKVIGGLYDGVTSRELDRLAIETAAGLAIKHPEYDVLASRLAMSALHKETPSSFWECVQKLYTNTDLHGNKKPLVSEAFYTVVKKHHKVIDSQIIHKNDFKYDYFGLSTLERSYLLRADNKIVERPQYMLMRCAIGIHGSDLEDAFNTYEKLSEHLFTHATPTLFNCGTPKQQLSSCFLLHTKGDSIEGIYSTLTDIAKISQCAGGIGVHVHNIRAKGSPIFGTGGKSNGIIPMLKVFESTARYIDQGGGKRKGSAAIYLEPWHADVMEFLDLRKNTGKDEIRCRDLNIAMWIPDLFMERVRDNGTWSLFCPNKAKNLQYTYGKEFVTLYEKYEKQGFADRVLPAREVWQKIIEAQIEGGEPYMLYKDAANRKTNQKNIGTIMSSNLCCEIMEVSKPDEIAVCNLGSLSLPKFVEGKKGKRKFNHDKLEDVVRTLTENLNKVIDINYYPVEETKNSNLKHRPIGIGVQGLADVFAQMRLTWDSPEALALNKDIFETIYYAAMKTSMEIAKERGKPYSTFKGSPLSEGKFQFDLWYDEAVEKAGPDDKLPANGIEMYCSDRYDWEALRKDVMKHGVMNSLLLAPMPTASTANILGNTECFEPITDNIYKRNTLSGEFVQVNKHLIEDLIELGIWDDDMKEKIVSADGSIQEIEGIPQEVKNLYRTVWEISQKIIIDMASSRAPFICQSQSMNIYLAKPTAASLSSMHMYGWSKGLKTGSYYIRGKAAKSASKVTVSVKQEAPKEDDKYALAILKLKEKGWDDATIASMNQEETIAAATEVCSLDNPGSCDMCSG